MKQLLILLVATFTTTAAFTHPGATDKNGWHTDSKTGKRHQHPKPEAKKEEPKKPEPKKSTPKKPVTPKKK